MKHYRTGLSFAQVSACLSYDPDTGCLTHKCAARSRALGSVAGRKDTRGYLRVRILGQEAKAHRLAWLLYYGTWPEGEIDHINGVPSDNRIKNLRCVDVYGNSQNRHAAQRNSKTGVLGVSATSTGFIAQIKAKQVRVRTLPYKTPEAAYAAYLALKRALHPLGTI